MTETLTSADTSPKQQFLARVETLLQRGENIGIAADFDQNISREGPSHGLDPRESTLDPVVRQAFVNMRTAGKKVVIISSRGAKDIARIVDIPGIGIVGSLGWETLDAHGVSRIHPQFEPFQKQITGILRDVRERFFTEQLHRPTPIIDEPNSELTSPEGRIILQRKGYNEEYPEGINATWALNLVPARVRGKYQKALQRYYDEAFNKHAGSIDASDQARLQELCGFMVRAGKTAYGLSTLDIEICPKSQRAKAWAIIQLMRSPDDPKRQEHFKNMPHANFWVYSGDNIMQDITPVVRAGHMVNRFTSGKVGVFGIWSKPSQEKEELIRGTDVVVDSVTGNAALMKETAVLIASYPKAA